MFMISFKSIDSFLFFSLTWYQKFSFLSKKNPRCLWIGESETNILLNNKGSWLAFNCFLENSSHFLHFFVFSGLKHTFHVQAQDYIAYKSLLSLKEDMFESYIIEKTKVPLTKSLPFDIVLLENSLIYKSRNKRFSLWLHLLSLVTSWMKEHLMLPSETIT